METPPTDTPTLPTSVSASTSATTLSVVGPSPTEIYVPNLANYANFVTTASLAPRLLKPAHLLGTTPWKASHLYPHAALYSLYVPPTAFAAAKAADTRLPLITAIHGTSRRADRARDNLVPLAERHGAAVLAPLFPAGVGDPNDVDNYKAVWYRYDTGGRERTADGVTTVRYDLALWGILDEIAVRWEGIIDTSRVWLTGCSGGAQFALRMCYLYPERLHGVSIGAPGAISRLDWTREWPDGVGNAGVLFGREVRAELVASVQHVQLVVGALDTDGRSDEIPEVAAWKRAHGRMLSRRETMEVLRAELESQGLRPQVIVVPNVGHDSDGVFPAVEAWLDKVLATSK
jgi:pimeloyl-ACP methyl ester carboxylesterase